MKAIAVMKGGHIVSGDLSITDGKPLFNTTDTKFVKSFNDIDDFKSYKNFAMCNELLGLSLTKKQIGECLKALNVKELYFYDLLPGDSSAKEFKEYWFMYKNHLCSRCANKCKQSSRVKIVNCKEFKEAK